MPKHPNNRLERILIEKKKTKRKRSSKNRIKETEDALQEYENSTDFDPIG